MSESDFVSSSHLNRHEEELNTLCEIAGILAEAPSQTTMLRQILETLERRLSMRRGTIMLVSGDGERLQIEAARSGGQKVKVVLAAATWFCPHLLILDEPTNYLAS